MEITNDENVQGVREEVIYGPCMEPVRPATASACYSKQEREERSKRFVMFTLGAALVMVFAIVGIAVGISGGGSTGHASVPPMNPPSQITWRCASDFFVGVEFTDYDATFEMRLHFDDGRDVMITSTKSASGVISTTVDFVGSSIPRFFTNEPFQVRSEGQYLVFGVDSGVIFPTADGTKINKDILRVNNSVRLNIETVNPQA